MWIRLPHGSSSMLWKENSKRRTSILNRFNGLDSFFSLNVFFVFLPTTIYIENLIKKKKKHKTASNNPIHLSLSHIQTNFTINKNVYVIKWNEKKDTKKNKKGNREMIAHSNRPIQSNMIYVEYDAVDIPIWISKFVYSHAYTKNNWNRRERKKTHNKNILNKCFIWIKMGENVI